MAKLKPNGSKHPDKFFTFRDDDGDLQNWGDTPGACLRNAMQADEIDDSESLEIAEYQLVSVKKYKIKYDAEEAK